MIVLTALLAVAILVFLLALPTTWVAMLFLGNIGFSQYGFWDILPGIIAIKALLHNTVTTKK